MIVSRNPKTPTLREACLTLGLAHSWVGPPHYKIADHARERGPAQYSGGGGRIDIPGSLIQSGADLTKSKLACVRINAITAFAFISDNIDISAVDLIRNTSCVVDSAHL